MTRQIENSVAFGKLATFQQRLVIRRENRLKIEEAITIARNVGYGKWAESSTMSSQWKAIVKELVQDEQTQCVSCERLTIEHTMHTDSDCNYFCPECWKELAPIMKAEYDELLAKGEIEPYE